jgi:hypothetical protein
MEDPTKCVLYPVIVLFCSIDVGLELGIMVTVFLGGTHGGILLLYDIRIIHDFSGNEKFFYCGKMENMLE